MLPASLTYKDAGVNISEGDKVVEYLKTKNKNIGGFSGLFPLNTAKYKKPMLVASTDGVGTKLLVAKMVGDYSTIGIDLVAMVVNDMAVVGATPLFFLDYYATSKLAIREARSVIDGILEGCALAGCPLIGGETAELPGLYQPGDFDLAGFAVGLVDASKAIDGRSVRPGDLVFGFASSGIHSNGYSLVRRVLVEKAALPLNKRVKGMGNQTLGKQLLEPTRIYTGLISGLLKKNIPIKALAHITGGGIPGNLNRALPPKCDAVIYDESWPISPVFDLVQQEGPVDRSEMFRTFNMGLGMMGVIAPEHKAKFVRTCAALGETPYFVGEITKGSGQVTVISQHQYGKTSSAGTLR